MNFQIQILNHSKNDDYACNLENNNLLFYEYTDENLSAFGICPKNPGILKPLCDDAFRVWVVLDL